MRFGRALVVLTALALIASACGGEAVGSGDVEPAEVDPRDIPGSGFFETSPEHFDAVIRASGGLPTVVNVWASWCIPCRSEAPLFRKAASDYEGRVRFLGLDTGDSLGAAEAFVEEFGIPYANGFDPESEVMRHLKVLGLPTTFFHRPDGDLAFVHNGEIRGDELDRKIQDLLAASR